MFFTSFKNYFRKLPYIATISIGSLSIYNYTNYYINQKKAQALSNTANNSNNHNHNHNHKLQDKEAYSENDIDIPTSKLQGIIKSSDLIVFAGSGNKELAKEIVSHLDITLGRFSVHKNPETEFQIELLDSVRGKRVFIIQSMCMPIHDNIVELFLMCSTLKRAGASKVTCIIPYFAYSRQTSQEYGKDRKSLAGSDICLMLEQMGCDQIVTINHNQQEVKGFFSPRAPLLNIDVNEMVVPYLLEKQLNNPVLISSHIKSRTVKRIVQTQKAFKEFDVDTGIGFIEKYGKDENLYEYIGDDVNGRDCVLFDNLIDTGNSLQNASFKLKSLGANRIFWFSPHGLLTQKAQKRIKNSFIEECIVTNSLEEVKPQNPKIQYLSVAKLLAEVISILHSDQSLEQFRQNRNILQYYSTNYNNKYKSRNRQQINNNSFNV